MLCALTWEHKAPIYLVERNILSVSVITLRYNDYIAIKDYIEMQRLSVIERKLHWNTKSNSF